MAETSSCKRSARLLEPRPKEALLGEERICSSRQPPFYLNRLQCAHREYRKSAGICRWSVTIQTHIMGFQRIVDPVTHATITRKGGVSGVSGNAFARIIAIRNI